ncbi:mediator of RNA polymerase II transcription subunit 4-like [Paramacrobiotus metropolitanus]|uniref:mediator of RNA polymerase II transcription subunit 4-like n=1 Tax=Paramacrobiotus metropolitanus TaxID=2943436 RepID=UPI00244644AB|nr:mediator of RNA polymerase II transcription subunit 4-like [Paramacrobiotus metropolitanus]
MDDVEMPEHFHSGSFDEVATTFPDVPFSTKATKSASSDHDPLGDRIAVTREPSTRDKLYAVLYEVELIYDSFIDLISSQPIFANDPNLSVHLKPAENAVAPGHPSDFDLPFFESSLQELIGLLAERQSDFDKLVADAIKEAEIEATIQGLSSEADRLKDQVMVFQTRLKEAEQILSNALHMAKQKTETVKAADEAQLTLDDIIRYAHRISVGFSAAAPANWMPGDPRRPYPTEVEMRAGVLAKLQDIPPPPNQILALPTENLTQVSHKFLGSNAGPYTMSPQPSSQSGAMDSPKTPMTAALQREVSAEEQDVETMSSDSSSSSSSEEE